MFHVGAREYDPRTARWLQRDPIGIAGGHPNVYLYCGNDPLTFADPYGADFWESVKKGYWNFGLTVGGWIDRTLMGGATENFGRTVGEYECGSASGWDVAFSGLKWGGGVLMTAGTVTVTVKGVYAGGKLLVGAVGRTQATNATKTVVTQASRGGAAPVRAGQAGEKAAGITGKKTKIEINGNKRIPDEVNKEAKTLTEVKNVNSLSYTKQLKDYMAWCDKEGYSFILYTRQGTKLSQPLQDLINQGKIIHKHLRSLP